MSRRSETIWLTAIVALALGVRLYFLCTAPNLLSSEHEGYSKINLMLQWLRSPFPFPNPHYGPLHTLLLWLPYALTGEPVFGARLLTLLFGMLLLLPTYRLVRRHGGPTAALGSLFVLAWLYPLTVGSVVTLAEIPFVCFTLLAIDLLDDLTGTPHRRWGRLIGAGLAAAAASALRFEGWPLLAVYPVWLLAHRRWREALVLILILAPVPLAHTHECLRITSPEVTGDPAAVRDPFCFLRVSASASMIHAADRPLSERLLLLPTALGRTLGWAGLLAGLFGAVFAAAKRRLLLPLICLALLLALQGKKTVDATLDPTLLRYLALPATLLALFVAWPARPGANTTGRQAKAMSLLAVGLVAATALLTHLNTMREQRYLEPDQPVFEMVRRLKAEIGDNERLLTGNEYHPIVVVESGVPHERVTRPMDLPVGQPPELAEAFRQHRFTLLILDRQDGEFIAALGLPENAAASEATIFGLPYRHLWSQDRWSVYRLIEDEP